MLGAEPYVGDLSRWDVVGLGGVAVIEEVSIEKDCVIWVNLGGDHLCIAGVGKFNPSIDAIPVFAEMCSVIEDNLGGDWEDEVAFSA